MESKSENTNLDLLSAERLCDLPLEVRVLVAKANAETYIRMYLYDCEFRKYANGDDWFKKQIVVKNYGYCTDYKINNIKCRIYDEGDVEWIMNEKYHKLDGPAVIYPDVRVEYWEKDKRHRINGPAVIGANGDEEYWENGVRIR
jgi:hypothetical protein